MNVSALDDDTLAQLRAAVMSRSSMKPDANDGTGPLWKGWAVMDAFYAGVRWGRENPRPVKAP